MPILCTLYIEDEIKECPYPIPTQQYPEPWLMCNLKTSKKDAAIKQESTRQQQQCISAKFLFDSTV